MQPLRLTLPADRRWFVAAVFLPLIVEGLIAGVHPFGLSPGTGLRRP